jgi:hypothetical protein
MASFLLAQAPLTIFWRPCIYCLQHIPSLAASRKRREPRDAERAADSRAAARLHVCACVPAALQREQRSPPAHADASARREAGIGASCPGCTRSRRSLTAALSQVRPRSAGIAPTPARCSGLLPARSAHCTVARPGSARRLTPAPRLCMAAPVSSRSNSPRATADIPPALRALRCHPPNPNTGNCSPMTVAKTCMRSRSANDCDAVRHLYCIVFTRPSTESRHCFASDCFDP